MYSAVDAHVGNFILKECFVDYLKGKTRVLVTHKFECLKYVDYIYMFREGKIMESGTFDTLKDSKLFHEIERKYNMQEEEKVQREDEEVVERIRSITGEINHSLPNGPKDMQIVLETEDNAANQPEECQKKYVEAEAAPEEQKEAKQLEKKLMLDEDREVGDVGWSIYKSYFKYYGGWPFFSLISLRKYQPLSIHNLLLVMTIFVALVVICNYWLSYWTDKAASDPSVNNYEYYGIFAGLSYSWLIFDLIRNCILTLQSVKCSRVLHKDMLNKLLRAPINLFFDRVPVGRIINRLSKDLTDIDSYMATAFNMFHIMVYFMVADMVVCLISGTVWAAPLILLFFFVAYKTQRSYMRINREVVRLGNRLLSAI